MYMDTPRSIKPHRPRASTHRSASHRGWTPQDRREAVGDGGRGEENKRGAESSTRLAWASSIRQRGRALHGECEGDIR